MPKTLYERDMEDSLRQIAEALGLDIGGTPDVEKLIRAAKRAGKDAERYRWLRDLAPAFVVRPFADKPGAEWDALIDAEMLARKAVGAA